MKNIFLRSACLVALTGFSGVLLSEAHSHTMEKSWVELKANQMPLQDIQEPGSAPDTMIAPATIVAAVMPVSQASTTPLRPAPQMPKTLIVGDLQLTTSLRPKMRPQVILASGGQTPRAASTGKPVRNSWKAVPQADRASGHVARNGSLSTGFETPANTRLQRWLAKRPAFDMGTQVGVFR